MNLLLVKGVCATTSLADRCAIIRRFVLSGADLINSGRVRLEPLPPGVSQGRAVANWMQYQFASGALRFIASDAR